MFGVQFLQRPITLTAGEEKADDNLKKKINISSKPYHMCVCGGGGGCLGAFGVKMYY